MHGTNYALQIAQSVELPANNTLKTVRLIVKLSINNQSFSI